MNLRVVVTGSAGFIGYHLTEELLQQNNFVLGIDNINDYYPIEVKDFRNTILLQDSKYQFKKIDLSNFNLLKNSIQKFNPDLIIHLAAQAGVRYSLENPHIYIQSNVVGFHNILECCRQLNIKKLVYASSSSVYGNNEKIPFAIDDRVDTPISLYAATKKSNELIAYTYSHLFGLQTIGLRFFTVYGKIGRPDMAIWKFVENIVHDKPIDVYNYGNMRRDFTHIDDIIEGIIAAATRDNLEKYEIFNLGNNQPEQLMNLINSIEDSLKKKAKLNLLPIQPGDVQETYADIDYSIKKLDFHPKTKLKDGVKQFVNWYLDNKELTEIVYQWRQNSGK